MSSHIWVSLVNSKFDLCSSFVISVQYAMILYHTGQCHNKTWLCSKLTKPSKWKSRITSQRFYVLTKYGCQSSSIPYLITPCLQVSSSSDKTLLYNMTSFLSFPGGEFHQPASLTSMSRNDTIRNITISRFQNSPYHSLTSIKHCYSNSNGFRTSMKSCNIILAEISVPGACPQAVCHHGNSSVAVLPSARNQRPHKVIFRPCTYCQRTLPAIYYTWPNEPWVPSAKGFESSPSKFHKNMFCSDMKKKDQIMLHFAHAMTAQLSWHVQNCDMIGSL